MYNAYTMNVYIHYSFEAERVSTDTPIINHRKNQYPTPLLLILQRVSTDTPIINHRKNQYRHPSMISNRGVGTDSV
jgi:hypothetical protein